MYTMGMIAAMNVEMEAMKAANAEAAIYGNRPEFQYSDFIELQTKYGIHHNALTEAMNRMSLKCHYDNNRRNIQRQGNGSRDNC